MNTLLHVDFNLKIESGNAAIVENDGRDVARILRNLADKIENGGIAAIEDAPIMDVNGNRAGLVDLDLEVEHLPDENDAPDLDPDSAVAVAYETRGTYGSEFTPCTVFVAEDYTGARWYVVEGAAVVNCTYCDILQGVDVEELPDHDCFTVNGGIEDLDALIEHVAEYLSE